MLRLRTRPQPVWPSHTTAAHPTWRQDRKASRAPAERAAHVTMSASLTPNIGQGEMSELAAAALTAHKRVRWHVRETPLLASPWLSSAGGCHAYLKLESEQHSNSFKVRGAVNKVLSLSDQQIASGLFTSSTGNHALAFVHACGSIKAAREAPTTIYLPTNASEAKVAKLKARGANVLQHGDDCVVAERQARAAAAQAGGVYISPYNDFEVMAGQGTVAVELLSQLPEGLDLVIVPVGGGGLIGGIAAVLKAVAPGCTVVGAQPAASDVMRQSVAAGVIVDAPSDDTLSDATAGGIEEGAVTLEPCMRFVDEWVTVSEGEIADAVVSLLHHHSKLVEGAAGCGLAAFRRLADAGRLADKRVVVVCCGGNVALPALRRMLDVGCVWGSGSGGGGT